MVVEMEKVPSWEMLDATTDVLRCPYCGAELLRSHVIGGAYAPGACEHFIVIRISDLAKDSYSRWVRAHAVLAASPRVGGYRYFIVPRQLHRKFAGLE